MIARIETESGTLRGELSIAKLVVKRPSLNQTARATITVARDALNDLSPLEPGRDRVFVEENGSTSFGGILRSPDRSGAKPRLRVASFAELMRRARPVGLGQQSVGVKDSELIRETIDATPDLSAGAIFNVGPSSGETWVFSGITQLAKARKVAESSGGELRFNADRTVDYVAERGSGLSTPTLSPSNGSFAEGSFTVEADGVKGRATHLAVYGVGQGTAQTSAAVVPGDDTGSFPEFDTVATYTNGDWSDGDDRIWKRVTNKDQKNADALVSYGEALISDLKSEEIRITTVVKGTDIALGQSAEIVFPEESIDDVLRAVEVTRVAEATGGERYECVFSNYSASGSSHENNIAEQAKSVGRYEQAFEGDLTQVQQGPGRGPVGSSRDYILNVYYPPDVVAEVNAQVLVKGTNYRAFSSGTAAASSQGSVNIANDTLGADRTLADGESVSFSVTVPSVGTNSYKGGPIESVVRFQEANFTSGATVSVELNGQFIAEVATDRAGRVWLSGITASLQAGDSAFLEITNTSGGSLTFESGGGLSLDEQEHSHGVAPGLIDFDGSDATPASYPSNVDVIVNGTSQGVSLGDGSGEFTEQVDVGGALSSGWNTIALSSDSMGHLDATFSADLFRQSL